MKNINEMTENEILEKIARITELTSVLEEKKAKISEEDNKRLEQFAYKALADLIRNVNNKDFKIIEHFNNIVNEYNKILSETNVYTEEELELCSFIMQLGLFSQIKK